MQAEDPFRAGLVTLLGELRASLVFLTRIPAGLVGGATDRQPDFREAARLFPVVGAIVGAVGGFVLLLSVWLGASLLLAASLAVLVVVALTGALHEDGLADTVDGFGGGATAERKLEIMDDSRVGTFGVVALVFSILIRVAALSAIAAGGLWHAALALVAAEAVGRAALVRLWHELPAARITGLAHDTGPPDQRAMLVALIVAAVAVAALVIPTSGLGAAVGGVVLAIVATYLFIRLTAHEIGGRTGDTLGACEQVAVIAFLAGVAIFA
jgi:adenosylcobinamide-GDP ribazoletransferase